MNREQAGARSLLAGWALVGWSALLVGTIVLGCFASVGAGEEGTRKVLRATAATSLVLFTVAFSASSLYRLLANPATRWLLTNRRYFGVSFAVSHLYHLVAIVALARLSAEPLAPTTLVAGGLAYVLIVAMTVTSFDRTAAWLGRRRWQRLHSFGAYYLWAVFALNYLTRAAETPTYFVFSLLLTATLALRLFVKYQG